MAALVDQFVGNQVLFAVDMAGTTTYVQADCQRDLGISVAAEQVDAGCKGSGDWGTSIAGTKSYTISLSELFKAGATTNHTVFFAAIKAATRFTWQATHGDDTDFEYHGTAVLNQFDMNFPYNDVAAFDLQAGGIGEIFEGVISTP